jgi:hypothetical protein
MVMIVGVVWLAFSVWPRLATMFATVPSTGATILV